MFSMTKPVPAPAEYSNGPRAVRILGPLTVLTLVLKGVGRIHHHHHSWSIHTGARGRRCSRDIVYWQLFSPIAGEFSRSSVETIKRRHFKTMALSVMKLVRMTMMSLIEDILLEGKSPSSSQKIGPAEGTPTEQKCGKSFSPAHHFEISWAARVTPAVFGELPM